MHLPQILASSYTLSPSGHWGGLVVLPYYEYEPSLSTAINLCFLREKELWFHFDPTRLLSDFCKQSCILSGTCVYQTGDCSSCLVTASLVFFEVVKAIISGLTQTKRVWPYHVRPCCPNSPSSVSHVFTPVHWPEDKILLRVVRHVTTSCTSHVIVMPEPKWKLSVLPKHGQDKIMKEACAWNLQEAHNVEVNMSQQIQQRQRFYSFFTIIHPDRWIDNLIRFCFFKILFSSYFSNSLREAWGCEPSRFL